MVKQGDHIVRLLQERLSETSAAQGDPLAFLAVGKSREAVREGVRVLDKGHDDVLGGWGGGRGGMKFPQVCMYFCVVFFLLGCCFVGSFFVVAVCVCVCVCVCVPFWLAVAAPAFLLRKDHPTLYVG